MLIRKYKIDSSRKKTKVRKVRLAPSLSIPAKIIIGAIIFAVILGLSPNACAFDLPDYDPWFFQSTEQGYNFWIPDKVQHFYGSSLLVETGKRIGFSKTNVVTPLVAFTAGFLYEAWQESKGVGFSERDLVADALGVASSHLSNNNYKFWMDYSVNEKTIMFRFSKLIG